MPNGSKPVTFRVEVRWIGPAQWGQSGAVGFKPSGNSGAGDKRRVVSVRRSGKQNPVSLSSEGQKPEEVEVRRPAHAKIETELRHR
jgi:hypothetical protein